MRERLLVRRRWWLAALAFAGVVTTHALAYRLAVADHSARDALLHDTGHDIWPSFVAGAALAAIVAAFVGSLTSGSDRNSTSHVRATAARLAALQGIGWIAVEAGERAVTGHAELSKSTAAPVLIGLVVQAVVALVAAVVLAVLGAVVTILRSRPRPPTRRPRRVWTARGFAVPRLRPAAAPWSQRGPPRL